MFMYIHVISYLIISLWRDDNSLSGNSHVRSIIYRVFYHDIVNITNGGRHIRITIILKLYNK
jgi:hypothetical protein